jgi:27-O-demethylrifamycin SV methyltransferase
MELNSATTCLIDVLAGMAEIKSDHSVLDVGCGMGAPALYLHEKYGCDITGISISKRGVELASAASEKRGFSKKVRFQVKDALENGFPENTFDLVWQMESSHLMRDKKKLFSENFRVLKANGLLLLCDLILINELNIAELYRYRKELTVLEKSFGKTKMEVLEYYDRDLRNAGFSNIKTVDISKWVRPTLKHWRANMANKKSDILQHFSSDDFNNFLLSCDIIDTFLKDKILGYGLVRAEKSGGTIDG